MAGIDDFVLRQKAGARFVLSAPMLRVSVQRFDALAQDWSENGGPGFSIVGMPHRVVLDGAFFISRVTAIKNTDLAD